MPMLSSHVKLPHAHQCLRRPPYLPEGMRRTVCEPGNPRAWNHRSVFAATLWLSLSFSLLLRPISTCNFMA